MTGSFDPETLRLLEETEEVHVETRRDESSPPHRTIIWAVVVDREVFVRSVRGQKGRPYRELSANPSGALLVGDRRIPVRGRPDHRGGQRRVQEQVRTGLAWTDGGDGAPRRPAHHAEALAGLRRSGCRAP